MTTYPTINLRLTLDQPDIPGNLKQVEINSHYKIDYYLLQYNARILEEYKGDSDNYSNPELAEFVQTYTLFVENVENSRNDDSQIYAVDKDDYRNFKYPGINYLLPDGNTVKHYLDKFGKYFKKKYFFSEGASPGQFDCEVDSYEDVPSSDANYGKINPLVKECLVSWDDALSFGKWGISSPRIDYTLYDAFNVNPDMDTIQKYATMFNFYFNDFVEDYSTKSIPPDYFLENDMTYVAENGKGLNKTITDLENLWKAYLNSKTIKPKEETMYEKNAYALDTTFMEINDSMNTKNYAYNYLVIQDVLNSTASYIKRICSGSFTEATIVNNTLISEHYDELIFTDSDIPDTALIVPQKGELADLITPSEIEKTKEREISTAPSIKSGKDMARVRKMTTKPASRGFTKTHGEVLKEVVHTRKELKRSKDLNFTDPHDINEAHWLMNPTIYRTAPTNPVQVEYFDKDKKDEWIAKNNERYNIFIKAILTDTDSRLDLYDRNYVIEEPFMDYLNKARFVGGKEPTKSIILSNNKKNRTKYKFVKQNPQISPIVENKSFEKTKDLPKFKFTKRSSQVVMSQTGGDKIDFAEYKNFVSKDSKKLDARIEGMNREYEILTTLDKLFFENKDEFDIQRLEQTNEMLIMLQQMTKIASMFNAFNDAEFQEYYSEIRDKIVDFDKDITNVLDRLTSRVAIRPIIPGSLTMDALASGIANASQLQGYFELEGLESADIPTYDDEIVFNDLILARSIIGLTKKTQDIGDTLTILRNLSQVSTIDKEMQESRIADLLTKLHENHSSIKSIGTSMREVYEHSKTHLGDLQYFKKSAADIISGNITLANKYMNNMLISINSYDYFIKAKGDVIEITHRLKTRIPDMEIYVSTMKRKVNKYGTAKYNKDYVDTDKYINNPPNSPYFPVSDLNVNDYFSAYRNYIDKSDKETKKIVPLINVEKKLMTINEKFREISNRLEYVLVLTNLIYHPVAKIEPTNNRIEYTNKNYFKKKDITLTSPEDMIIGNDLSIDNHVRNDDIKHLLNNINDIVTRINSATNMNILKWGDVNLVLKIANSRTTIDTIADSLLLLFTGLYIGKSPYIIFYPDLINKINFPDEMKKMLDVYMPASPVLIIQMCELINDLFTGAPSALQTKTILGNNYEIMNYKKIIKLVNIIYEYAINYNIVMNENMIDINGVESLYREIGKNKSYLSKEDAYSYWSLVDPTRLPLNKTANPTGYKINNYSDIKNFINKVILEYDPLVDMNGYIKVNILKIKNNIIGYIKDLRVKKNLPNENDIVPLINKYMTEISFSVYELFYLELASYYNLLYSFLSDGGKVDPNFPLVVQYQKEINDMYTNLRATKINEIYTTYDSEFDATKFFDIPAMNLGIISNITKFNVALVGYSGIVSDITLDINNQMRQIIIAHQNKFNKFSTQTIKLLDFMKNIKIESHVLAPNFKIELKIDPTSYAFLYDTPKPASKFCGANCPVKTTLQISHMSNILVAVESSPISGLKSELNIPFDSKINKDMSRTWISDFIKMVNTENIILSIFPHLLKLKTILYAIGNNTGLIMKLDTDKTQEISIKKKTANILVRSLTTFDRDIDRKIRLNAPNIVALDKILLDNPFEFETRKRDLINANAEEIDDYCKKYLKPTYIFLSSMTALYISFIFPIMVELTNIKIFTCVKNEITYQLTKIGINSSIDTIDATKIFPYVQHIGRVTKDIVQKLKDQATIVNDKRAPLKPRKISPADLYDHYYDNIKITENLYPMFHVVITSTTDISDKMKHVNEICTEIAHLDVFTKNLKMEKYMKPLIKKIVDEVKTGAFGLDNEQEVLNRYTEIINEFHKCYYLPLRSPREKYIRYLNLIHPNANYHFADMYTKLSAFLRLDPARCFLPMWIESNLGVPIGKRDNFFRNYGKIDYVAMDSLSAWDIPDYHYELITHINLGRLLREARNNMIKPKVFFGNILASMIYEYTNFVRYYMEELLKKLALSLKELEYAKLKDEIYTKIKEIITKNEALQYFSNDVLTLEDHFITKIFDTNFGIAPPSSIKAKMIYHDYFEDGYPTKRQGPPFPTPEIQSSLQMIQELSASIGSNISKNIDNEHKVRDKIIKLDSSLTEHLRSDQDILNRRKDMMTHLLTIMDEVMFNKYYQNAGTLGEAGVIQKLSELLETDKITQQRINAKLDSIIERQKTYELELSRQTNYNYFNELIGVMISPKDDDVGKIKIYKQMSFTLIEIYRNTMRIILKCIAEKPPYKLSAVHRYLSECHFVTINRCYKLFDWLLTKYLPDQQKKEIEYRLAKIKAGNKLTKEELDNSILKKKLQLALTTGDMAVIFEQFNAIRDIFDKYATLVMPPVSIYLRINDFETKKKDPHTGVEITDDPDPMDPKYIEMYDQHELVFMNDNENFPDNLQVYFPAIPNPGGDPNYTANIMQKYQGVRKKMEDTKNPGIQFTKICNTIQYPDSDVIANQMSTGPLLLDGKGIMLVTYGYSGVGKTVTLFGKVSDPPKPGMLQSTLDQLPDDCDIYFRVYEIYGLGTQFDFSWNPKTTAATNINLCFPEFYQMLIHHKVTAVKDSGTMSVDPSGPVIFTNKADMLSYIMELKQPGKYATNEAILRDGGTKSIGDDPDPIKLQPDTALVARQPSLENSQVGDRLKFLTYVPIDKSHYNNFSSFVADVIEAQRKKGFAFQQIVTPAHTLKQIKPTINNPDSSRSILVYDFQIREKGTDGFTPFLIYDLPGKEDLYKTYIDKNPTQVGSIKGSFSDILHDKADVKERKANYVTNPFLLCSFDDNIQIAIERLRSISGKPTIPNEEDLIDQILDTPLDYYNMIIDPLGDTLFVVTDTANTGFRIRSFYDTKNTGSGSRYPINFNELLQTSDIATAAIPVYIQDKYTEIQDPPIRGLLNVSEMINGGVVDKSILEKNVYASVMFGIIYVLIKNNYFDVIIDIISTIATRNSVTPTEGLWTADKIYAFFEAYYINENISGILHYLLTDPKIMNRPSSFPIQPNSKGNPAPLTTYSFYYKQHSLYLFICAYLQYSLGGVGDDLSGLDSDVKVPDEFLIPKTYAIDEKERRDFFTKHNITREGLPGAGQFIKEGNGVNNITVSSIVATYEAVLYRLSKELYFSNGIFRNGIMGQPSTQGTCSTLLTSNPLYPNATIIDPNTINVTYDGKKFITTPPVEKPITNLPLIQEFIDPYKPKINNYYIFYLISNTRPSLKAEEQLKLLDTGLDFIDVIGMSEKKKSCV